MYAVMYTSAKHAALAASMVVEIMAILFMLTLAHLAFPPPFL
jgi:hypothetical protein